MIYPDFISHTQFLNLHDGLTELELLSQFSANIKQIHKLTTAHYKDFDLLISDYLMSGLKIFDLDIGIVSKEDLCILFSKSGETKELIQLIPYIRKKGARLISVVSNSHSKIANLSDYFVLLPVQKELCPFHLAPTKVFWSFRRISFGST